MKRDWINTWSQMSDLVRSVTYKPGWEFTLVYPEAPTETYMGTAWHMWIEFPAPDSRDPENTITITQLVHIPMNIPRAVVMEMIYFGIYGAEEHEINEFFKVAGAPFKEAHPKKKEQTNG
jgi:hypothetical protein